MKVKKTMRQLKELSSSFAGKINVPNDDLLNEVIPHILHEIVLLLQSGSENSIEDAINLMNAYRITIDQFKENVLDLCANHKAAQMFTNLSTKSKSSLTRIYHKLHPDPVTKQKIKGNIYIDNQYI